MLYPDFHVKQGLYLLGHLPGPLDSFQLVMWTIILQTRRPYSLVHFLVCWVSYSCCCDKTPGPKISLWKKELILVCVSTG